MESYEAAIILGGGIYTNEELTELSRQRLDQGVALYNERVVPKLIVLGAKQSTYSHKAVEFSKTGAEIRKNYLIKVDVEPNDIITIENGRDTIGEALAVQNEIENLGFKKLLLVTSNIQMERALWIFRRVINPGITIDPVEVECGNILIPEEEREYLSVTKEFFQSLPEPLPPQNLNTWINDHAELYEKFKSIHDKYHPPGNESQAYVGVES